ncbi:MAG: protein kinase [Acidobacteria bacterium]|nr:protein kinase [Acidobacteriota bacterium]
MMTESDPMNHSNETDKTRRLRTPEEVSERWEKISKIFEAASALTGKDREKLLQRSCGEDADLRKEVEKLLASFEDSESFLDKPAIAEAASLFAEKKTLPHPHTTGDMKNGSFMAGTVLASRYRIQGLLGKGGMGEVYKAEDIKLSQTVALKFLPDHLQKDAAALARFHAEVRHARQVAHVNVCRVFDIGEIDRRHFLSMEYVDGDDLSSLLRRVGRFSSERAVELARQLCVGLSAIHNAGILHRDFKPANVIIDSKGKARITDFGIAGLEAEIAQDNLRAGTPAYMSPEQISGKDVSAKSDIYALGLVLYEIFTGKQAFTADSIPEMIRKQTSETPTNPSEFVKGLDPLVESVITQCIAKNPNDRPQSALHVAMALPGGNPLQIALDAGQTPTPEMIAASPKKGALKPVIALSCLIGAILMIGICLYASMKIAPQNRIPFTKSSEVLSERANVIISKFGYTDAPVGRDYRFYYDDAYEKYALQNPSPENWEKISSGQPLMFVFSERQSPRHFDMVMVGSGLWRFLPQTTGGMRTISLDTRGRLVEFSAVPPQFTGNQPAQTNADFAPAFSAAELDLSKFKETAPNWTPPVAFDTRKAWEGALPDHSEIPLRIEAAAFQGKIIYFKLIYPWTKPDVTEFDSYKTRDWIAIFILAGIGVGILLTAIFLARKNFKSGSGDLKGAFKTALIVLVLTFSGWLLSMNHVPSFFPELDRFTHSLRLALYWAASTWLFYLALEPVVRRNLPELIVSWNRLLAGDWRDPLVGRDVLLATLCAVAHTTLIYLDLLAQRFFYNDYKPFLNPNALIGLRSSLSSILSISGGGISMGFAFVCLLVILFLMLRRKLYAGIAIFVVIATIQVLFFTHSLVSVPFTLAISAMISLVISRLGLVAAIIVGTVNTWMLATLFTLNFSAWYTSGMFVTLFLILALLVYGFKISLANQQLFGNRIGQ